MQVLTSNIEETLKVFNQSSFESIQVLLSAEAAVGLSANKDVVKALYFTLKE